LGIQWRLEATTTYLKTGSDNTPNIKGYYMNRVRMIGWLLVTVWSIGAVVMGDDAEKPNIVLILIDNIGYGDLGCYGNREIKTPHVDQLAEQGVRCADFYIGSPSCMPSRGALMTGRHPVRNGLNEQVYLIDELEQRVLSLDERLFPQYMRELGYATACFGKWNLGFAPGHRPTERGFDEYLGNISGNCDYVTHVYNGRHDLYRGTEPVQLEGYTTDIYADAACDFMRHNRSRSFFVYVPFNAAHYPNPKNKPPGEPAIWQAPDEYFDVYGYDPQTRDERQRYRAVVTALDAAIGKVVRQVDELGLRDNTIVVVLSDNGAFMIPGRGLECASNRPLKGGGTLLYEGGIRVPCIVRWPKRFPSASVCNEPLWSMDFLALAIVAAGGTLPHDRVLDGRDPTATLAGEAASPHKSLCFHYGSSSAVRQGRYKLYRRNGKSPWELYDLKTDIGETATLTAREPHLLKTLIEEFERFYDDARQ